jgi:hypothetical protein
LLFPTAPNDQNKKNKNTNVVFYQDD